MGHHPQRLLLRVLPVLVLLCLVHVCRGGHKGHHQGNKLIELLTAGIVAKVLQKNDDHDGGGGHHGYYAVPIPIHSGHHHSHGSGRTAAASTHVTEKIIPIPVPHHTTRIIHINAGSHGISGGEGGGFNPNSLGGFSDSGGGGDGYSDSSYDRPGNEIDGGDYHHQDDRSHHSPTIQQIMFHDGGVYGMPQAAPRPVMMRRPVVGMVQPHTVMPVRVAGMMPHPVMAAAHHPMVRVRNYYPLASGRHRMLAYPSPLVPYVRYRPPPMPYQAMIAG